MSISGPFMVLGAASYAVYLLYDPFLSAAVRVAAKIGLAAFLSISVVALMSGLMYRALRTSGMPSVIDWPQGP